MMRASLFVLLTAAFASTAGAQGAGDSGKASLPPVESARTEAFPIGFIDIQRVYVEYRTAKQLDQQLQKEVEQMQAAQYREKEKITGLRDGLDLLVDGSKEQLEVFKKIRLAEVELELNQRAMTFDMQVKFAELIKKVYSEILKEVKAVAEEKGVKLVLMFQAGEPRAKTRVDAMNDILVRPVLYFDPAADLTSAVLDRLNK